MRILIWVFNAAALVRAVLAKHLVLFPGKTRACHERGAERNRLRAKIGENLAAQT